MKLRAKEENEIVKSLMSHPGCWLNDTRSEGKDCQFENKTNAVRCTVCPAYQAFFKTADDYMRWPGVFTWSEALWLTGQFYGIKKDYMCDGEEEAWLKEFSPQHYRENLKRQEQLLSGAALKPDWKKAKQKGRYEQMTLDDFMKGAQNV